MRPLKLEMCAFGPYKDKICIDFKMLGEQGIYLITGDTGSGKTTIFDAISFALFGVASGSRRENGSFRSDFANDEVKTYVKLDFYHKDIYYQIERFPKYFRKKIRGEGKTVVGGDASLTFLDKVVTGDKNVTMKCVEILGINASQFKQIAMIAQGEFLNLLLADSKDRASIFRHIFDTDIYKRISDELKNLYLEKKREYEDDKLLLSRYIDGIIWCVDEVDEKSTSEVLDLLDEEIIRDKKKELELNGVKKKLAEDSLKVVEKISEGKILNTNLDNLKILESKLEEVLKDKEKIVEYEKLLEKNIFIWELIVPKYQEVKRLEKELSEKNGLLVFNQEDYQKKCLLFDKILVKYNNLDILEKQLSLFKEERILWQEKYLILKEVKDLEKKITEKNIDFKRILYLEKMTLLNKFESMHRLEENQQLSRNKFIEVKYSYEKERQIYLKNYDLFLNAQAGILALELKDNCPCPVCGSLEHPCKAKMIDEVLSRDKLNQMRDSVDNLQKDVENLSLEIKDIENLLENLKIDLSDYQEEILEAEIKDLYQEFHFVLDSNIYDKDMKQLELELHGLEVKLNDYLSKLNEGEDFDFVSKKLVDLDSSISNLEKEMSEIRNNYEKEIQEKIRLESVIQILIDNINELNIELDFKNNEYVSSYQELGYKEEKAYLDIKLEKEKIKIYENKVKFYYDELKDLEGKIFVLRDFVKDKKREDLSSLELTKKELDEKLNDLDLSLKEISNKLLNNINSYDKIKSVYEKSTNLEKFVMMYKDLSDTANGNLVGKNKLEFEQFVQAYYFDLVIRDANKRFLSMTEDRYELFRKESSIKLSDKLGLELEVMDYYTGKKRDIKSLSGGESFKAALSLALGMSDTIQSFAGGVVVDTMFIDEGFGSLDDESLNQALNTIMSLSQEKRMIGIISHVNELKVRIDKKIIVSKSNDGSKVSFVG